MRRTGSFGALLLVGILLGGCDPGTPRHGPSPMPKISGPPAADVLQLVHSELDWRYTLKPGDVADSPPVTVAPCDLDLATSLSDRIDDKQRAQGPKVPIPAGYELRTGNAKGDRSLSVYLMSTSVDYSRVTGDLLVAAGTCGKRSTSGTDLSGTGPRMLFTSARVITRSTGAALVVSTEEQYSAPSASPAPQPGWTIGSDGKLAPDGPLRRPDAGTGAPRYVPYAQVTIFATQGRFLLRATASVNPDVYRGANNLIEAAGFADELLTELATAIATIRT